MKSNLDIVNDYLKGERPLTIVGWQPEAEKKHAVGESWTDIQGRDWIQKENGPVRLTKLDGIRESLIDKCKCCGTEVRWGSKLDKKMYFKTGKCFDCLIKEETSLRIRGQYHLYEQKKIYENQLAYLKDVKKKLREGYDWVKDHKEITYVNSNGFVESWVNEARDDLFIKLKGDFKTCLNTIREVSDALMEVNRQIDAVLTDNK